jgi:hypothetical protein
MEKDDRKSPWQQNKFGGLRSLGLWVLISVGRKFMITVFIINLYINLLSSGERQKLWLCISLHVTTLPWRGLEYSCHTSRRKHKELGVLYVSLAGQRLSEAQQIERIGHLYPSRNSSGQATMSLKFMVIDGSYWHESWSTAKLLN